MGFPGPDMVGAIIRKARDTQNEASAPPAQGISRQDAFFAFIDQFGYVAVAALILLENVFPPVPSEPILPMAGFLVLGSSMSLPGVIVATAAALERGRHLALAVTWPGLRRHRRPPRGRARHHRRGRHPSSTLSSAATPHVSGHRTVVALALPSCDVPPSSWVLPSTRRPSIPTDWPSALSCPPHPPVPRPQPAPPRPHYHTGTPHGRPHYRVSRRSSSPSTLVLRWQRGARSSIVGAQGSMR